MAADGANTPNARPAAPLAPLPDHRNVNSPWWQELWRLHAHITTPLRERGLECDIEFGLSASIVRVALPDDSYLIISPPQEPPCDRPPGDPEGWIVTRQHPDKQALFEVIYDSAPSADPSASERPEARHGGNATHLIEAIDQRLIQLRLLPAVSSSTAAQAAARPGKATALTDASSPTAAETDLPGRPNTPAAPNSAARAVRSLTERLNAARSYNEAAHLLDQVLDPASGVLEHLADFFEAAGKTAKSSERQDGYDLHHDLRTAEITLRRLGEDLHVAVERMQALAAPRRRSWQEAVADYYGTGRIAPALPPPPARAAGRAP
ncbi:hypothetical protein ABZ703_33995 [Streptomyces massasporeus]|uniref:hypothetical protein n=1 Tax=Streptomyces massasporeus TaxID=67324 RepID=UPI0034062DDC